MEHENLFYDVHTSQDHKGSSRVNGNNNNRQAFVPWLGQTNNIMCVQVCSLVIRHFKK